MGQQEKKSVLNDGGGNSNPQVLVLCQLFYPELVSTGQTLTELCEVLAGRGMDVEVVCGPPTVLRQDESIPRVSSHRGIKIRRVWGTKFPKLNLVGRVVNQLTFALSVFLFLLFDRSKRPVLVLTNPPFLPFSCALLRALGLGKKYIYVVFDVYPDTAVGLGVIKESGLLCRLWHRLNVLVLKHAAAVVVIGRCMKDVIVGNYRDALPGLEKKIHSIHVWSDDNLIRSAADTENPFIEKWGLRGKFVVSYSGNMGRFHDMETIMEAVQRVQPYPDIEFLFIGEGHKKKFVQSFIADHGLRNCQVHTYVDREDLGHSLSSADVGLVSLAEGQEGLSVPSKTYGILAAGVPVLAIMPETSEIARMLNEEDCGIVVRPGDSESLADEILGVYRDREKLARMSANARRAIQEKYNLNAASSAYYELICKVAGNYRK